MRTLPRSLRPVLERLRDRLRERFGERLRSIVLFGSFAKRLADEDSDVDVLVVVDGLRDEEVTEIAAVFAAMSIESGFDLAPLPLATERHEALIASGLGIANEITQTGVPL